MRALYSLTIWAMIVPVDGWGGRPIFYSQIVRTFVVIFIVVCYPKYEKNIFAMH